MAFIDGNPPAPAIVDATHDSVPIFPDERGTSIYVVVALGGHPVRMVLDTGASSSVISPTLANNLIQWGHAHWLGKSKSVLADGRVIDVGNISINEVHIGNNVLHDVRALVNQSDEGSMLLGLETLNQIGPFTVDISKGELRFNPKGA